MLPSDAEGIPMAMVEQRTSSWDGTFEGSAIEPFEEVCNSQPTLSFQLRWSKTPGCFREKDVVKPTPAFASANSLLAADRYSVSASTKPTVLDAIGVRTDSFGIYGGICLGFIFCFSDDWFVTSNPLSPLQASR